MKGKKKGNGVHKKRLAGPAKRLIGKVSQAVATRKAQSAARKTKADQEMKAAVQRGLKAVTPAEMAAINANPKLAQAINEEAAVRAAAEYGVNIRKPNGKIDMRLARKAAEAAAIQSAAELGVDIKNARGGISRRKAFEAARLADAARTGKDVDPSVKAAVDRQDAKLTEAVRDAQQRGFSPAQLGLKDLRGNPGLAGEVAEEALILAATEAGIDIRGADGRIDRKKGQDVARITAILSAAELGIDLVDSRGKISRRQAIKAAKLAETARAGKPVSAQVQAAVSRQDARMMAAYRAVQRRGEDPATAAARPPSRREAFDDAELAALVRGQIR